MTTNFSPTKETTMNHYLVRLRHTMDDVPLLITDNKPLAMAFADHAPWQPSVEDQRAMALPDMSTPVRIDVIEFVNGQPNEVVHVRIYEDESE